MTLLQNNGLVYGLYGMTHDDTVQNLNIGKVGNALYFGGRTIRFGAIMLGSVPDLALQFFQASTFTVAHLSSRVESTLRHCQQKDALTHKIIWLSIIPAVLRDKTTKNMLSYLVNDLNSITSLFSSTKLETVDFARSYQNFLFKAI
jgi:hypothetical protein